MGEQRRRRSLALHSSHLTAQPVSLMSYSSLVSRLTIFCTVSTHPVTQFISPRSARALRSNPPAPSRLTLSALL